MRSPGVQAAARMPAPRMPTTLILAPLVVALLVLPRVASARAFGYHEHDGFYLRLGLGAASLRMSRQTQTSGSPDALAYEGGSSSISGSVGMFEVSVGGSPLAGLAVGATVLDHSLPDATLELADGGGVALDSTLDFSFVGLTVDAFPWVEGGLHVGGGAGVASASAETPTDPRLESLGGNGLAATFSAGYDQWIADQWSLGGVLRFTVASLEGRERGSGVTGSETDSVTVLGLMFTALHH